ncbi:MULTISPECIES: SapB/AmfS family lanthipeptide [Kribbella]|nr:SapB/AmfS family lanthipeptide [Kribbella catacumbae]
MVLLDLQGLTVQGETLGVREASTSGLSLLLCDEFSIAD